MHTYLIIFSKFLVGSRLTNPDLFLSLFIYFFSAKKPLTGSKSVPNPTFNAGNNLLEKTTEGVLKAARLGDLQMLSELHHQGYSLLSIDETGKTALHYGSRFGKETVIFNFTEKCSTKCSWKEPQNLLNFLHLKTHKIFFKISFGTILLIC